MQKKAGASARPGAILAAGAAVQLLTGLPAAWGVLQQPVRETYGLGELGATAAFSVLIASYGAGCVIGGFLQDKAGPRIAGFAGTALLAAGFFFGVGYGILQPLFQAFVTGTTPPPQRMLMGSAEGAWPSSATAVGRPS